MSEDRPAVFAFACRVHWAPEWRETIYNTTTSGKAKLEHFYSVRESWPGTQFTDIRSRKIGPAHTSEEFRRCAKRRGLPELECGQAVMCNGSEGTVVGHNSNANFNVLFHRGPYVGQTLSVHPSELEIVHG